MFSRFEQFTSYIFAIQRDIQKIERVEMDKFGLKGPHVQCMLALNHHPEGLTASQLCTACDKDKAAISRTLAELEQDGMVQRQTNNGNRYRAVLHLTAQGQMAATQVEQRVQLAVERAGEGLTDEQRRILYAALGLIAGNLHAICAEGLED